MPKLTFAAASDRSLQRRAHGDDRYNPLRDAGTRRRGYGNWVAELTAFCDEHAPANTQGTTAAGRLASQWLFIATDAAQGGFDLAAAATRFAVPKGQIYFCANKSGLHKEMSILRLIAELDLVHPKNMWLAGLEIGTTKGCCLDCAGYLNELGVPHTDTSGSGSNQWEHPYSKAVYQGQKKLEMYQNPRISNSLNNSFSSTAKLNK